jgi:hypothetical protein
MSSALGHIMVISRPAWHLLATQAGLVTLGGLALAVAPAGPLRAVLLLPVILWVPGRSVVAALGLARSAGPFAPALAVAMSIVVLITAALGVSLLLGHVPFTMVPLATAAVLLPLNLFERTTTATSTPGLLTAARYGVALVVGLTATGGALWFADQHLPTVPQAPYLEFSFGAPYAQVAGTIKAKPGDVLQLPVVVSASDPAATSGLAVTTQIDGQPAPSPASTAINTGRTGEVTVQVPAGCLHQIRLVLERGGNPLRSVDLYVSAPGGRSCGGG